MKKWSFLLTTLAAIGLIQPSFAATRANTATFTLGAGDYIFASSRHLDNAAVPFGALGYNFTREWGIEGLLASFNTDSHDPVDEGQQVNATLFSVDGIYHFNAYRGIYEPYLMAGVGILGLNPNGNDANNEGNINAGLGISLFLDPSIALRFEARDFYTIVGTKNDVFLDGGVTFLLDLC